MSIHIVLENPPEFYTNLDVIRGHVVLNLSRPEHVGAIVVKLEGESRTSLVSSYENSPMARDRDTGNVLLENHKILYKVGQVFPDDTKPSVGPYILNAGQHRFAFQFKFPFNNICGDQEAMARIGGVVSPSGPFGLGFRVMDGSRQLLYPHVTKTLPPSFTGFPGQAEIRYYLKVTVQRPGLFKENWRYQMGLKFLPIEPPRPAKTNQEAYARRPYTFHVPARAPPSPMPQPPKQRSSFFGRFSSSASSSTATLPPQPEGPPPTPPSIEISARLPHPPILTCNKPVPLRLIAKKLVPANSEVYLIALQIDLIGKTLVRCHNLANTEITRWVIMSRTNLNVLISRPGDAVGSESIIPDNIWNNIPLPNTVMPSFVTCNLRRDYQLEVKIGLAWQLPGNPSVNYRNQAFAPIRQELHLPLNFSSIQVFSGLTPPAALVQATLHRPTQPASSPPPLPPRPAPQPAAAATPQPAEQYPPAPPYDDAPPTYEEAMAEMMTGPMFPPGQPRPAYSGVTDEHGPSSLPEGDSGNGSGGHGSKT